MSEEVIGLLDALEDCLIRARARIVVHAMKDDSSIPKDVKADLVIALGRLNMAVKILDDVMRKLEIKRGRFINVSDGQSAFNHLFKR